MGVLASLASLISLKICNGPRLPACLSALTRLERLFATAHMEVDGAALEAALPRLQRLTRLLLFCHTFERIPPAIASLSCLQRLCFDGSAADALADLSLPQGAWLASIRWLGLPWGVLRSAVGTLRAAPHLEYLCSSSIPTDGTSSEEWAAFWRFVAAHPPLRCLGMEHQGGGECSPAELLLDTILTLRQRHPELQLRRLGAGKGFITEVLHCTDIPSDPAPSPPF